MRAATIGSRSGIRTRTNAAPIQYGRRAPSAATPPTVGASQPVLPLAMLTM